MTKRGEYQHDYYRRNKEKRQQYFKEYYKNNKEKIKVRSNKRYAEKQEVRKSKKDIYKKSLKGPTLEEYGDCEELSFYKKTEEEIMTTIPLEQRVYLGLPIKEEEYNNFQKELSLGLLLMR